jgi:hypothetical protein
MPLTVRGTAGPVGRRWFAGADLVVGELLHLAGSDLAGVRPRAVGMRVVGLEQDVVFADGIEHG